MKELLNLALLGSKRAGAKILSHYDNFQITQKQDKSPLTNADLAANDELFYWLSKSGYPICSEEQILSYKERKEAKRFWLIDPLDGTKEFIAKNGEFCVCVALIEDGLPILGVIYIPISDEIFYSFGDGVYKNEILLSKNVTFSNSSEKIMLVGSTKATKSNLFAKEFGFSCQKLGSAIKFCRICEGKGLIYPRFGGASLWDIAAGDFLVRQSGGNLLSIKNEKMLRYDTESLNCDQFIAVNQNLTQNLEIYLKSAQKIL